MESDPLTTPGPKEGLPPVPQAVVQSLTRAAIFLVVTRQPRRRQSRGRPVVLRRPPGAVARGRFPRHRGKSLLRDGDRVGGLGQAVWGSRGRRSCIRFGRSGPDRAMRWLRRAICCSTSAPSAWISASSWRRRSWRSWRRGYAGRRGAWLSLFRRPRSARLCRRHGEPDGASGDRRRLCRRRGRRLRRRQLRDRAEISARSGRLECAVHRSAGAHHRPHQAFRHRARRCRQADAPPTTR